MKAAVKQSGLTLIEMTVVIAIAALLVAFGLPAIRVLFKSFESASGTKAMINAALSSARAIAAKEQHYAGLRFQNKYQPDDKGCQYMIFIVQDSNISAFGFKAVDGLEPIKLPDRVGVMDLIINVNNDPNTFSIVFSPSGKLVIHDVRVRNRDGKTNDDSKDDIFNTKFNVEVAKIAMFYQDYANMGLVQEESRNSFVICDRNPFKSVEVVYINPYTGTMINRQ